MLEKYLNYILYTRCFSFGTYNKHRKALIRLERYLEEANKSIEKPEGITLVDVYNFIENLRKGGLSPSSCNAVIDGIRSYFRYLSDVLNMNVINPTKIKGCKVPERNIGFFNKEQKKKILKVVNDGVGVKSITQLRNRLLTYMLYNTGLRCHELANIKVKEIGESLQVIGKGGKRRTIYLKGDLLDMIDEYLSLRKRDSEYLFSSSSTGHLREGSIRNIYNKISKQVGFRVHAHKFRHTFATDLLHLPGCSIYDVATLMGHSRISTTQIYLGIDNKELKKLQFRLRF